MTSPRTIHHPHDRPLPAGFGPASGARSAAIMASVVLAVLLNAGAVGVAASLSSHGDDSAGHAVEAPRRSTLVWLSAHTTAPAPEVTHVADVPAQALGRTRQPPPGTRTPRADAPDPLVEPAYPVRFYTFMEVDSPAYPRSDWNLDVDALEAVGISRLVFEVLVNDRGEVVECTVLDPTGLPDDARRGLEQRLRETNLQPAQRAGQLVASMRRIELVVVPQ